MNNIEMLNKRRFKNILTGKSSDSLIEVYANNPISENSLKWFFELGYVPGEFTLFENIIKEKKDLFSKSSIKIDFQKYIDFNYTELVKLGKEKICQSVSEILENTNKNIILPITSGLDSRILLGALLENVSAEKITTLTWGIPDGIDCKVGAMISKKMGIEHHLMDLNKYELTQDRLFNFAVASDFSVPLFDHWPVDWVKELANKKNGALWMGLLGGTISGSNLPNSLAENPYAYFLNSNRRINSLSSVSAALLGKRPEIDDLKSVTGYIQNPSIDSLDIQVHHMDLISPTKIHKQFSYEFPFMNKEVMSYFLSLPYEYRKGRGVFKDILLNHFKDLSKFPSNRSGGLPLNLKGRKRQLYKRWRKNFVRPSYFDIGGSGKYLDFTSSLTKDTKVLLNEALKDVESIVDVDKLKQLKKEFNSTHKHYRLMDAILSLYIFRKKLNM